METTDVFICGCGPTGAMLASQLNLLGVPSICVDKEEGINTDPRGIALDEDGIRALQSTGIYDKIYSDIGQCMGIFKFVGGVHTDLDHPPFLSMDYTTTEGGTGHVGFICHKQPHLEKHLRRTILTSPFCQVREGCELTAITEDQDWVYATYRTADAEEKTVRARFLVGADGKTGFTRKKYLEPKGIIMEQSSRTSYEEMWVAVNWRISLPTPTTHPDFPLWKLGYNPEDVFDLFFPRNFRFLCNPNRPAVCGRFGTPAERLWRFEFVVRPGEDGNEISMPENLAKILHPYITHPGNRYELGHDVAYPSDCIETLRARPFLFAARSCNKWSLGRVILSGDSAHVFPPFGGQGLASGFRDACSLAWRLKLACQPTFTSYEGLFEGWYKERKQQLEESLAATVENGRYVTEGDRVKIFFRDTYIWMVQSIPWWRRELEKGARRHGMCCYKFQSSMHFVPEYGGGLLLPQVYYYPLAGPRPSNPKLISFTDDEIFSSEKRSLFQLLVVIHSTAELRDAHKELENLEGRSDGYITISESTTLIMSPKSRLVTSSPTKYATFRVATAEEFAASPLCRDRPSPKYYEENRIAKECPNKRFIIVRPDRFIFAACADAQELGAAWDRIGSILSGDSSKSRGVSSTKL